LVEDSEKPASYCGLFCSACGLYQGRIRQAVENLRKVTSTYGFDKIAVELADHEPAFRHYTEFEKVLDSINHLIKDLPDCLGCGAGGGDPSCSIRQCCREKDQAACTDCLELDTCAELIATPFFQHRFKALRAVLGLNP